MKEGIQQNSLEQKMVWTQEPPKSLRMADLIAQRPRTSLTHGDILTLIQGHWSWIKEAKQNLVEKVLEWESRNPCFSPTQLSYWLVVWPWAGQFLPQEMSLLTLKWRWGTKFKSLGGWGSRRWRWMPPLSERKEWESNVLFFISVKMVITHSLDLFTACFMWGL